MKESLAQIAAKSLSRKQREYVGKNPVDTILLDPPLILVKKGIYEKVGYDTASRCAAYQATDLGKEVVELLRREQGYIDVPVLTGDYG